MTSGTLRGSAERDKVGHRDDDDEAEAKEEEDCATQLNLLAQLSPSLCTAVLCHIKARRSSRWDGFIS